MVKTFPSTEEIIVLNGWSKNTEGPIVVVSFVVAVDIVVIGVAISFDGNTVLLLDTITIKYYVFREFQRINCIYIVLKKKNTIIRRC